MPQTRLDWKYPIGFINFAVLRRPRGIKKPSRFCVLCRTVLPTQRADSFGEQSQSVLQNAQNDHVTLAEVAYPYNAFVKVKIPYPYGMSLKRAHAPWVFVLRPKICAYSTFVLTI